MLLVNGVELTLKMMLKIGAIIVLCLACTALCDISYKPLLKNEEWWNETHAELLAQTKTKAAEIKVVFLGDSITEMWKYNGKRVWDEHYAKRGVFNYGVGGDKTEHVLWRIENGELDGLKPKLVVLKIGTNNIFSNTAADIAKGIETIVADIRSRMSNANILLLSVLPRDGVKADEEVHKINALISAFADKSKHLYYFDLGAHYETSLGHQNLELYEFDRIHLSPKGYEMWYKQMEPLFKQLTE